MSKTAQRKRNAYKQGVTDAKRYGHGIYTQHPYLKQYNAGVASVLRKKAQRKPKPVLDARFAICLAAVVTAFLVAAAVLG